MLISEKVAYLKGLFDGLDLDEKKKDGKMIKGILDVLSDIASSIEALEYDVDDLNDNVEEVYLNQMLEDEEYDDFDDFEDFNELYDDSELVSIYDDEPLEESDEEGCDCGCGCGAHDEMPEDLELDLNDDEDLYEVVCPTCGEEIFFDEDTLDEGSMKCYACGEDLEFDTSLLEDEDEE